jgi:hypothetical protein
MKRSLVAVLMAVALSAGALQTARLANQPGFFLCPQRRDN